MNGKKMSDFIDELYMNPEMELVYHNERYLISGYVNLQTNYTLSVDVLSEDVQNIFSVTNSNRSICVSQFEEAKIFDGRTIYEAEDDITVLYG